jgi:hypothetical protein
MKASSMNKFLKSLIGVLTVFVFAHTVDAQVEHRTCFLLFGEGLCPAACRGDLAEMSIYLTRANNDEKVCAFSRAHDASIVRWLVENGIDINVRKQISNTNSPAGRNALFEIIFSNQQDLFDAVIANHIDVNVADAQGTTPLMSAAGMGRFEMTKELLENGADVTAVNQWGNSALCEAEDYLIVPNRDLIIAQLKLNGAVCHRQ